MCAVCACLYVLTNAFQLRTWQVERADSDIIALVPVTIRLHQSCFGEKLQPTSRSSALRAKECAEVQTPVHSAQSRGRNWHKVEFGKHYLPQALSPCPAILVNEPF